MSIKRVSKVLATSLVLSISISSASSFAESPLPVIEPPVVQPPVVDPNENKGVAIKVKAILAGAYDPKTQLMRADLLEQGLLPKQQPYTHDGSSSNETLSKKVLKKKNGNAAVDWVLVELRDAKMPSARLYSTAAIIQRDSDVVSAKTGKRKLKFNHVPEGDYFISLRHRNHLGVMTAQPVKLTHKKARKINFSNPNLATSVEHDRKIINGKAMLWAGDANQDNKIFLNARANDLTALALGILHDPQNINGSHSFIVQGYQKEDLNLDGRLVLDGVGNDSNIIWTSIIAHPSNTAGSSRFVIIGEELGKVIP